jgi:hypothetical protein
MATDGPTGAPDRSSAAGGDGPGDELERAWDLLVARVDQMRSLLRGWPDGDARAAAGTRYLLGFLAAGIRLCVELDDTDRPQLGAMVEPRMTWGLDNPDCNYRYARLDGTGTYRLTGHRGGARHLELQVNSGHFGDGDFTGWQAVSSLNGDQLHVQPDGTFTVTLTPEASRSAADRGGDGGERGVGSGGGNARGAGGGSGGARGGSGNTMLLDERAGFLLVRQYFADWAGERPAHLVLERLDRPAPPRPLDTDTVAGHLVQLSRWLETGADCWDKLSRAIIDAAPGEIQPFVPPASASGLKGLAYGFGPWACTPDQAVILAVEPPNCRLWGLSLCDRWWQSIDYAERQSSLNSHQAELDDQGRLVAVLCHDDPGVANWLDPGGETRGTVALRYLLAEDLPPARLTTIERSALHEHLPASATRITPGQRRESLAVRRAAVLARFGR